MARATQLAAGSSEPQRIGTNRDLAEAIAIFSGAQLALAMLGEYLTRMHFSIMKKPTSVVRSTIETEAKL